MQVLLLLLLKTFFIPPYSSVNYIVTDELSKKNGLYKMKVKMPVPINIIIAFFVKPFNDKKY